MADETDLRFKYDPGNATVAELGSLGRLGTSYGCTAHKLKALLKYAVTTRI
jgi:hypothetical protein